MQPDRVFSVAFGASAAAHLLLLAMQLLPLIRPRPVRDLGKFEVVYEYPQGEARLERIQEHLAQQARAAVGAPSLGAGPPIQAQIRIPDHASLAALDRGIGVSLGASVVDLTDLVEASGGNPVLMTYFTAIREQIQQTANQGSWVTTEPENGLVYISFLLVANGTVSQAAVIGERSSRSAALRDIALRLVRAAAPFPPFPPSMDDPSKTIIVPLEFLQE